MAADGVDRAGSRHQEGRSGITFTVPGILDPQDLYGDPCESGSVLFAGGNQFMVVPDRNPGTADTVSEP